MDKKIIISRMKRSPFFLIGFALTVLVILLAVFGPVLATHDPLQNNLMDKLVAPGVNGYILGTDQLGRDIFSRILSGARISLLISFCVCILSVVIGTILGLVSGYCGGIVDAVIMRMCDVILALPLIVITIALVAVLGNTIPNLIIILTMLGWVEFCKLTRNNVLVVKNMEFVSAIKVLGGKTDRILFKEIFPNVTTTLLIQMSLKFGNVILTEASLSFLGLGIMQPTPSWGNMIADGRNYLAAFPWVCLVPGVALMITILAFNFLGDGLRDVLDPKRT